MDGPATPPPAAAAPATPPAVNVNVTVGGEAAKPDFHEFLVMLDDQAVRKVEKAFDMPVGPQRRAYVAKSLIDNMMKTQQPLWDVIEGLQSAGHVDAYQPLWIQNSVVVHGDDEAETVLAHAAGVADAVKSQVHTLDNPTQESQAFGNAATGAQKLTDPATDPNVGVPTKGGTKGLLWNVSRMGAPKAWAQGYTGEGVVLGSVDTGVDVTHPDVRSKFRGYDARTGEIDPTGNWFDATDAKATEPTDDEGHGTHTEGTQTGSFGPDKNGMAPGAKWIAARGLGEDGGTDGMLLRSLQFMAAPRVPTPGQSPGTRRDLTLGADVINNSWGSNDGLSASYANALRNMAAMGIVNVFAAGNDGQGGKAGSVGSPASSPYIISVGATDRKDKVAEFSSRGPNPLPTPDGEPVPFVSAPGVDIFSSIPGGKFESGWDGTSMATPAVTGTIALIQQAALKQTGHMFDVNGIKDVFRKTAQDIGAKGVDDATGYGIPAIPDNLDAVVKAVAQARGLMPKAAAHKPAAHKPAAAK